MVSLGCPKALVDSERILTQLRAQGYELVKHYQDADLVVVNTCGFIDAAVEESLDAIGEALEHNGKVIVTGCLGAREEEIRSRHPKVLKITGAHAYEAVVDAVHEHLPPRHDPFTDLVPPQGIKLTPRHYAYLKISEGCNHRCSFCIIPSMRGLRSFWWCRRTPVPMALIAGTEPIFGMDDRSRPASLSLRQRWVNLMSGSGSTTSIPIPTSMR